MATAPKPQRQKLSLKTKPVAETPVFNVHQAKTQFSKLLERVARGEEIIIAKANRPVAKLVPLPTPRKWGTAKGLIWMSEDFNDPMPEFEAGFYEGDIIPR